MSILDTLDPDTTSLFDDCNFFAFVLLNDERDPLLAELLFFDIYTSVTIVLSLLSGLVLGSEL